MAWRLGQSFHDEQVLSPLVRNHLLWHYVTLVDCLRSTRFTNCSTRTAMDTLTSRPSILHYTELPGGGLTRAHWQELISWWESPERTEGGTDGRLAAAIAMREAKRK